MSNLTRRNPRKEGFNRPHPDSTAGRIRTSGDAKLKKALHDWLNEVNDDAKAYERWYFSYRRTF